MNELRITFSNEQEFLIDPIGLSKLIMARFNKSFEQIGQNLLPFFVLENFKWEELKGISRPVISDSFAYALDFRVCAEIEVIKL